jgi:hypothetical protein
MASYLTSTGCSDGSALYLESLPMQKCIGDDLVRLIQDPAERRPRDIHLRRRVLMLIPVEVGKPDRLQFIQ